MKEGTSRRHLHATLSDNVDAYSFEVSMLGYEVAEAEAVEMYRHGVFRLWIVCS